MITTPNRIGEAIAAMEKGEQVDWRKQADLQALDLAVAGQRFMEQAVQYNEQQIDRIAQTIGE